MCCCCAAAKCRKPPERCTVQRKKSTLNKPLLRPTAVTHQALTGVAFAAQKMV
jgi:hypothetical protein